MRTPARIVSIQTIRTRIENPEALPNYPDEVLRSLRRIIRAVDLYSRRLIAEHGLSGPQLLCLRQLNTPQGLLSGQLASAMSLSPATVCGILDRLESRGLVTRERQKEDKRRVLVRLTPEGKSAARKAPAPLESGFLQELSALPLGQQARIDGVLKGLVRMMSAEELDAAPFLASGTAAGGVAAGQSRSGNEK